MYKVFPRNLYSTECHIITLWDSDLGILQPAQLKSILSFKTTRSKYGKYGSSTGQYASIVKGIVFCRDVTHTDTLSETRCHVAINHRTSWYCELDTNTPLGLIWSVNSSKQVQFINPCMKLTGS